MITNTDLPRYRFLHKHVKQIVMHLHNHLVGIFSVPGMMDEALEYLESRQVPSVLHYDQQEQLILHGRLLPGSASVPALASYDRALLPEQ